MFSRGFRDLGGGGEMNEPVAGIVRAAAKNALPLGLAPGRCGTDFIDRAQSSVSCLSLSLLGDSQLFVKPAATVSAAGRQLKRPSGFDICWLVAYTLHMPTVTRTDEFSGWLKGLRDIRARAKILARIDRLELGNPGDVAPVGEGVSELRIHYGPGYRVYIVQRGEEAVILLCGGDKSSQEADIARAKKLAGQYK
jgi:putative addiction module killer protein